MQVTARAEYAVQAVVELASLAPASATRAQLATAQAIPGKFLEAILIDLKKSGLLAAQRGAAGGYTLAIPAERIALADIIRAVDGPLAAVRGLPPESSTYSGSTSALREVWVAVRASLRQVLETTSVADVVSGDLPETVRALVADDGAWHRRGAGSIG